MIGLLDKTCYFRLLFDRLEQLNSFHVGHLVLLSAISPEPSFLTLSEAFLLCSELLPRALLTEPGKSSNQRPLCERRIEAFGKLEHVLDNLIGERFGSITGGSHVLETGSDLLKLLNSQGAEKLRTF